MRKTLKCSMTKSDDYFLLSIMGLKGLCRVLCRQLEDLKEPYEDLRGAEKNLKGSQKELEGPGIWHLVLPGSW